MLTSFVSAAATNAVEKRDRRQRHTRRTCSAALDQHGCVIECRGVLQEQLGGWAVDGLKCAHGHGSHDLYTI